MIVVHIDHFLIEHIQTNQKEFSSDQIHISSLAQHHNTNDTITIELRTICMQRGLDFNDWRFYVTVVTRLFIRFILKLFLCHLLYKSKKIVNPKNLEPYKTIIASKGSLYPIMYLDNYMFCCRQ